MPLCCGREVKYIDLFAPETGAYLAIAYAYLKKELMEAGGEVILERMKYEVQRQVIEPFVKYDMNWMMHPTNNWATWSVTSVLTCTALMVEDMEQKRAVVEKCCRILDTYIGDQPLDGGCDEGPCYWSAGGAALFESLELLYDMTGGTVDLFGSKEVKLIMEYVLKVHISDAYYVNYGDGPAKVTLIYGGQCRRMGRRIGSQQLEAMGEMLVDVSRERVILEPYRIPRFMKCLTDKQESHLKYNPECFYDLPQMQLCVMRDSGNDGFCAWLKGGDNGVPHNHNDVGSFGIYVKGRPVVIDFGAGIYTKATFSELRYTLFAMNSRDHNLPLIGGKGECAGADYRTSFFETDEKNMTARTELSEAYENREEIDSFVRTLSVRQNAVLVRDDLKLKVPQKVAFRFQLKNRPMILGDGRIDVGEGVILSWESTAEGVSRGYSLVPQIEEIVLEDSEFIRNWGNKVYCLVLETEQEQNEISMVFQFSR